MIDLSRVVCRTNMHVEGVQTSQMKTKVHNSAGDATWGEGRQGRAESPGRGRIRGKGKASRRVETEANGVF